MYSENKKESKFDAFGGLDICLPFDKKCQERKATEAQAKLAEAQALAQAASSPSGGGDNTVLIVSVVLVLFLLGGLLAYFKLRSK
jgi:hypothetical protein